MGLTEIGGESSEFIIPEIKEEKFPVLLSGHLSAAAEVFDKMKTENHALHLSLWWY